MSRTDLDWQQLPHPPALAHSVDGLGGSTQAKAATPAGDVLLSRSCAGIGEPMFLDLDINPHEALTFREVFLRSRALENLVAGALHVHNLFKMSLFPCQRRASRFCPRRLSVLYAGDVAGQGGHHGHRFTCCSSHYCSMIYPFT